MSNDLIPFDDDEVPAHLTDLFGENANDDLAGGVNLGYPVISYRGKVWAINEGGNRVPIMRDVDGDQVPSNSIEVVIVKANPNLSKVYYKDGYEEGSNEKPTCYSNDGKAPAPDAQEPQASACLSCVRNAWGSRTTENGTKAKECADSRRLVVVPSGQLDRPMLLRVPAGSLKDLVTYGDMLKRRKVPYQAVVTRVSFDTDSSHPKFVFKAKAWLNEKLQRKIADLLQQDVVQQILGAPTSPENQPAVAKAPQTQASVSEADVDEAMSAPANRNDKPKLAVASDVDKAVSNAKPAGKKKNSKVSSLLQEADAELDSVLKGHLDAE